MGQAVGKDERQVMAVLCATESPLGPEDGEDQKETSDRRLERHPPERGSRHGSRSRQPVCRT
jgi:hypothetical protein